MKKTAQLSLLEKTIKELGYIVVVNKFLPLEGKIYTLAKVISKINPSGLSPETAKLVDGLVDISLFSGKNKK